MKRIVVVVSALALVSAGLLFYWFGSGSRTPAAAESVDASARSSENDSQGILQTAAGVADVRADAGMSAPNAQPIRVELPFERNLLQGQALNMDRIGELLQFKDFELRLDRFASEAAGDQSATELTDTYRDLLAKQFEQHAIRAEMTKLVCGVETCVGLIRAGSEAEYERWAEVFFNDPGALNYGFANLSVQRGDGGPEHRFVFSTDPAVNVMTARK